MNKRAKNDQDNSVDEAFAAKLAFIGSAITTIGDGITTYAAGVALKDIENSNIQDAVERQEMMGQLTAMQKQLDMLLRRIDKLERAIGKS